MKRFLSILSLAFALVIAGCSSDEPNSDNGSEVKPDQNVPDPTGTIELSMRNNDDTSLGNLYIGADNNFHGYGMTIASVGKVNGLGNVSTIPQAGWAYKVAVTPEMAMWLMIAMKMCIIASMLPTIFLPQQMAA